MLHKNPKGSTGWKFLRKSAIAFFVAEGLAFVGSYAIWYKLNTDQEFRLFAHQNCPAALEYYYKIGGIFGNKEELEKVRTLELAKWEKLSPPSN